MGMLNSFSQLLITHAFWSKCINIFVKWVGNYGWAIILFTIALKLILTPLDVLQRVTMKKQTEVQAKLQPQIAKIQEQYGNDREKLNKKMNELYSSNNVNLKGTCLPLLITLVVTMVVFISLFNALNAIATSKDSEIFYELNKAYDSEYAIVYDAEYVNNLQLDGKTEDEISQIQYNEIKDAVLKEYKTQKDKHGFLWIQNLWKADTTTSPFVKLSTYTKYYEKNVGEIANEDAFNAKYDTIVEMVETKNSSNNGYYILIILAGVVTFLVQYLSQLGMNKNNAPAGQTNKIMLIVMPLIMLVFASTSNALFCIYIIVNSIISASISKIIDLVISKRKNKDDFTTQTPKSKNVVEYSRNYFKD